MQPGKKRRLIPQGTVSVLVGCHSPFHSILVCIAWKKIHGKFPRFWETLCIFLHDIGHIGKNYLDDYEQKKQHWKAGARIAGFLFGPKGYDLVAGHDIHGDRPESKMYRPDKYSWHISPRWWLWLNIFFERKLCRPGMTWMESVNLWKETVKENIESGKYESNHTLYLRSFSNRQEKS